MISGLVIVIGILLLSTGCLLTVTKFWEAHPISHPICCPIFNNMLKWTSKSTEEVKLFIRKFIYTKGTHS